MDRIRRIARESWRFYLGILALSLFLVLMTTVYLCQDNEIAFTGTSIEVRMQETLAQGHPVGYSDGLIRSWLYNIDGNMRLIATTIGILLILFAKKYYTLDTRAEEFYRTLPVKDRSRVLYDYFAVFGIILCCTLIQDGILLFAQNHYNETAAQLSIHYGFDTPTGSIKEINENLLICMGFYLLFILLNYTWMYLVVTAAKNPLAGCGIAAFMHWSISYILDALWFGAGDRYIVSYLSGYRFFDELDIEYRAVGEQYLPFDVAGTVILMIVLGIFMLILIAGKRDLSVGKWFYFPSLDYVFAMFCGFLLMFYMVDYHFWAPPMAIASGFVVTLLLCNWIHPFRHRKVNVWEVK